MDEWTLKISDHNLKLTPQHADVMNFTNHWITASCYPVLEAGETVEFDWSTTGTLGLLKNGSAKVTSLTTSDSMVAYYSDKTLTEDNNPDKVTVTAYIKKGTSRKKIGTETANINVKKLQIIMKPEGYTLSPKSGLPKLELYLLNTDGTDPIINGTSVQYKVVWSTQGKYGHFIGGNKQYVTAVNKIQYEATDYNVINSTDSVKAEVYFKVGPTMPWTLRQVVSGVVKIDNDPNKKYVWLPMQWVHYDTVANRAICSESSGVFVDTKKYPGAKSFKIHFMPKVTAYGNPTLTHSIGNPGQPPPSKYLHSVHSHYEYFNGVYFIGYQGSYSLGSGSSFPPDHRQPSNYGGGAQVVVYY